MSVSAVIKTVARLVFVAGCYALKLLVIVIMCSGQRFTAMHLFWVVLFSTCCANYNALSFIFTLFATFEVIDFKLLLY